jgi:hypothetical protein
MKELSEKWTVVLSEEIRRIPELAEDEAEAEQELMDMIVEELESERITEQQLEDYINETGK